MKNIAYCTFFLLLNTFLNGQSAFRIKVVDAQTSENIERAIVFIEETPFPDQETDRYGVVSYQNLPEDRKLKVNIRKKGYLPNQTEIVANRAIKVDNNVIIKLEREPTEPQTIIYGEVTDIEGNDVEGAAVEISILGKPYNTTTDKGGNYQFRIDGNNLKSVPNFQIEVKKSSCETFKSTEVVPKSDFLNKNIKLSCNESSSNNNSSTSPPKNLKINSCLRNYDVEFVSCFASVSKQNLEVQLSFKHTLANQQLFISAASSKAYSKDGQALEIFESCIGAKCAPTSYEAYNLLPSNQNVNVKIKIRNILSDISVISTLIIKAKSKNAEGGQNSQECLLEIKNIPIKWNQ